jgi:hypothetical protein
MNSHAVDNKHNFAAIMKGSRLYPRGFEEVGENDLVICKPPNGYGGKGHQILPKHAISASDLLSYEVQELLKPMLLRGKKFSVRMLFIWKHGLGARLAYDGVVFIAPNAYDAADLSPGTQLTNSSIHHQNKPPRLSDVVAELFADKPDAEERFRETLHSVPADLFRRLANNLPAPDDKSYDLYGVDIMLTEDGSVKIMEANCGWSMGHVYSPMHDAKMDMFVRCISFLDDQSRQSCTIDFLARPSPTDLALRSPNRLDGVVARGRQDH